MPLRKSPLRTPALVAARRANACKSHGPKTIRGKARSSLNALKHGRYAIHLRRKLIEAGDRQGEALYARIEARVAEAFCSGWIPAYAGMTKGSGGLTMASTPGSATAGGMTVAEGSIPVPESVTPAQAGVQGQPIRPEDERQLRQVTALVWCFTARRRPPRPPSPRTILECAMESLGCPVKNLPRTQIQVHDGCRRIGLVFWFQRRRLPGWKAFWRRFGEQFGGAAERFGPTDAGRLELTARERAALRQARLQELGVQSAASAASEFEGGLRSRIFRLRRPNIWQRLRYGLYPDGTYSPELEAEGWRELKKLCLAGIPVSSCPPLLGGPPGAAGAAGNGGQGGSAGISWALIPFGFGISPEPPERVDERSVP